MPQMLAVLSATHVVLVVAVVVLLFGAQKIPELMRSVGSGIGEFKKGLRDGELMVQEPASPKETASPRPE